MYKFDKIHSYKNTKLLFFVNETFTSRCDCLIVTDKAKFDNITEMQLNPLINRFLFGDPEHFYNIAKGAYRSIQGLLNAHTNKDRKYIVSAEDTLYSASRYYDNEAEIVIRESFVRYNRMIDGNVEQFYDDLEDFIHKLLTVAGNTA